MANPTGAYGFRPLRYKSGLPYNGACNLYLAPANIAAALYIGDPVVKLVAGSAPVDYYGMPANSLPQIARATAGASASNWVTGVVVGLFPEQATSPVYNPATTLRGVYVADDPNLVFSIRDDGSAVPDYTWPTSHADFGFGSGGNANTGLSGAAIVASTKVAIGGGGNFATNNLRIVRLRPDSPANTTAIYAEWEVCFNQHTETVYPLAAY
jgi:hypothetical protein